MARKNKEHKPIPATIEEEPTRDNGYQWVVNTKEGRKYLAGIGAPNPSTNKVGDKGTVQYSNMGSMGAWFAWKDA